MLSVFPFPLKEPSSSFANLKLSLTSLIFKQPISSSIFLILSVSSINFSFIFVTKYSSEYAFIDSDDGSYVVYSKTVLKEKIKELKNTEYHLFEYEED